MDITRELQVEAKVDARRDVKENIRGVEVIELEIKFEHDDRLLRVYIDPDRDEYYIDIFAAHSIGLMGYQVACGQYESGRKYYKVTLAELNMLKKIFKDRIMYEIFPGALIRKKNNENEVNPMDNYDRFIGNDIDESLIKANDNNFEEVITNDYKNPGYYKDISQFNPIPYENVETDDFINIIEDNDINKITPDDYSGTNNI